MLPGGTASAPAAYDGLGKQYDRYWRNLCVRFMPALDRLGLASLPRGSRILDLCCGTGHLAAALSRRGFEVTGLDESQDMLRFARQNAPEAEFLISDAREFKFSNRFDAVISTGDSLNHILTKHDLNLVFRNVLAALVAGGRFTFDMNMAQAFETQWSKSSTDVGDDRLIYIRGRYDKCERLGSTEVTLFEKAGEWKRVDLKMFQRCYIQRDVKSLLLQSGFVELVVRPAKYFGIRGRLAIGRTFFRGRKPTDNPLQHLELSSLSKRPADVRSVTIAAP